MDHKIRLFEMVERHVEDCELCKRGPCKTAEALFDAAKDIALSLVEIPDVPRSPHKA